MEPRQQTFKRGFNRLLLFLLLALSPGAIRAAAPTVFLPVPTGVADNVDTTPFGSATVSDSVDVRIGISFPAGRGTFPVGGGLSLSAPGVYQLSERTPAAAEAFLQALVFTPNPDRLLQGVIEATTFTLSVTNTGNEFTQPSVSLNVTGVNVAPTVNFSAVPTPTDDKTPTTALANLSVSDADGTDNVTVTITHEAGRGSFPVGGGLTSSAAGVYELGNQTPASAQAFLRALVFTPVENRIFLGMTETTTFTVVAKDGAGLTKQDSEGLVVTPVNDPPTFTGAIVGPFTDPIPDNLSSLIFSNITVADVDNLGTQPVVLSVKLDETNGGAGTFPGAVGVLNLTNTPAAVTTALRAIAFDPVMNRLPVDTIEAVNLTVTLKDSLDLASPDNGVKMSHVISINDLPVLDASIVTANISDSQSAFPFAALVSDADTYDSIFTLFVEMADTADHQYGALDAGTTNITGSKSFIESAVRAVRFVPLRNSVVTSQPISFRIVLTDQHEFVTNIVTLNMTGVNDPPDVVGASPGIIRITDDRTDTRPFESMTIIDVDNGGQQLVTVTLSLSDPSIGTFAYDGALGPLTNVTPSAATAALRGVRFIPAENRIPVGQTESVDLTVRVRDDLGAERRNSDTRVAITSVNGSPKILGIPALVPRPIPPAPLGQPVRPFLGLSIEDDGEINDEVTVTITLDDADKGILTNLAGGGFTLDAPGSYSLTGTELVVTAALTNLGFLVNQAHVFPPNEPGGTSFAIRAVDVVLNTTVKTLSIVIQEEPRNWMVTDVDDVLFPGTLRYALNQIEERKENNAVVTFALQSYPATIRLTNSLELLRNVTLRGPGADKLIITGDSDGNRVPDTQLFRVHAVVVMHGLTLTEGTSGNTGGAIYVGQRGNLTLHECAVTDSWATQWGGAIDVEMGSLHLRSCFLKGNFTGMTFGLGGGAVSIYSDEASSFINTTFSGNEQRSANGFGGGAVYVENMSPASALPVRFSHCTFAENFDAADMGSSILANVFGTHVRMHNSIVADGIGRNLEVLGGAEIDSEGGNLSDDTTRTISNLGGQPQSIFFFDQPSDQTDVPQLLEDLVMSVGRTPVYPLGAGSAAKGSAVAVAEPLDQRGVVRDIDPDSGAFEQDNLGRVIINEIQFAGAPKFVELFVPRNSTAMDLSGYALCVGGSNALIFPAATVIQPGFGAIVADTVFTATNTLVFAATQPLDLADRGLVELKDALGRRLAVVDYVGIFADLNDPPSMRSFPGNSLTLAPQFMGAAYLPHSIVLNPPFGGANLGAAGPAESPGRDTGSTPFGLDNGFPTAQPDEIIINEDQWITIPVLANDVDADGNDILAVVDLRTATDGTNSNDAMVTTVAGALVTVEPVAVPLRGTAVGYDPRSATLLQQLPEGIKRTDQFFYSIVDVDTNSVERTPSQRSEARVLITVLGVNDPPTPVPNSVATDEETIIRILGDTNLLGTTTVFDTDDEYAQVPLLSGVALLDNDTDPDTDDTGRSLKLIGVLGSVHGITNYMGVAGTGPVTVTSTGHGLVTGNRVLISGYGGHPSYNGYHSVTVLGPDRFSIPVPFVDNAAVKGVWAVLNDGNRLQATSAKGAQVMLEIRTDRIETSIVYNPNTSAYLNALGIMTNGLPEVGLDSFYYAVMDRHGAVSIAQVTVEVSGVNDLLMAVADPGSLSVLDPVLTGATMLMQLLSELDVLYSVPPASGTAGRMDAQVEYGTNGGALTFLLPDLWFTDEDHVVDILSADLLSNDTDVDRNDILKITAVEPSREGGTVTLSGDMARVTYDPTTSTNLNRLSRGELMLDSFKIVVTDLGGGSVTSLVSVLVIGVNDSPIATDDNVDAFEDMVRVFDPVRFPSGNPALHDIEYDINGSDPDDRLVLLPTPTSPTMATGATFTVTSTNVTYDPTRSSQLDGLARNQTFLDMFNYTVTDRSFLFANDDIFKVAADGTGYELEVMGNDRNFTGTAGPLRIVALSSANNFGDVSTNATGTAIIYTPVGGFVGDEMFVYTLADDEGNTDTALVTVRVTVEALNGNIHACEDVFSVAKGEAALLNVLANDNVLPASGASLLITRTVDAPANGQVALVGGMIRYTPNSNYVGADAFSYEISGGGTARATGTVSLMVTNRMGTLFVRNDAFSVVVGSSGNPLDVLANDNILPGPVDNLRILSVATPSSGMASINAGGNGLLYTPNAGFLGWETFNYTVTDGVGGTGTGAVRVNVGSLVTCSDFFVVPYDDSASTNDDGTVFLDVLANDRVLEAVNGTVTVVSVSPTNATLGTMTNAVGGTGLVFDPATDQVGEQTFVYTIEDGAGGQATGEVTVLVSNLAPGQEQVNANADGFTVALNSGNNSLDVLANDVAIPDRGRRLTILSLGTGVDGPNRGGSVTINASNDRLIYRPARGFVGEEAFTYTMTDSRRTDAARVVVRVSSGDLSANDDAFTVFYVAPPTNGGPGMEFNLPVLANDRVLPNLGQVLRITGVGIDDINATNAPSNQGEVRISAGGTSLIYIAKDQVGPFPYVERFTYEISDGSERRAEGVVMVEVLKRLNHRDMETSDDAFAVEAESLNNLLAVLVNDNVKPATATGWIITEVTAPVYGGTVSISGTSVLYSPAPGFVGTDGFSYMVSDGFGGTGSGTVKVKVGDQRVCPDYFTVISGSSANPMNVLLNDAVRPGGTSDFVLLSVGGADRNGTVTISGGNVLYTPDTNYAGIYPYQERFHYSVEDDSMGTVTGQVAVAVHERGSDRDIGKVSVLVQGVNDAPVITNAPVGGCIFDIETIRAFAGMRISDVDSNGVERLVVTIRLDNAVKGVLTNLGGFVLTSPGLYTLAGTPAVVTAAADALVFVPTRNRITLPSEITRFTIVANDGLIMTTATVDVKVRPSATSLVTGYSVQRLRNDFTGEVGMKITVSSNALIVTQLGRSCNPGNSQSHQLRIVRASDQMEVPGSRVTVTMGGCTNGMFVYTVLPVPVGLAANTTYYVVSSEVQNGDKWWDADSIIQTTTAATADGAIFKGGPFPWSSQGGSSHSFTLVDVRYALALTTVHLIETAASPDFGGGAGGGGVCPTGDIVQLKASALPGFTFGAWTEGGAVVCDTGNYNFSAIDDRSLVATFDHVWPDDGGSYLRIAGRVNGNPVLALLGQPGQTYLVEASLDCVNWGELTTVTIEEGPVFFQDEQAQGAQGRFYRAMALP